MQNQLKKAINLAKKTGDRLILVDTNTDESFVVINLDQYEELLDNKKAKSDIYGLTEGELIDKINRDIAVWKNEQELSKMADFDFDDDLDEDDDLYYYEEDDTLENFQPDFSVDNLDDGVNDLDNFHNVNDILNNKWEKEDAPKEKKSVWKIPSDVKEKAEEVL